MCVHHVLGLNIETDRGIFFFLVLKKAKNMDPPYVFDIEMLFGETNSPKFLFNDKVYPPKILSDLLNYKVI